MSRRRFLSRSTAAGLGLAAFGPQSLAAAGTARKLRVLCIGVTGTIGGGDRMSVASHPLAEITGLCDVDADNLARAAAAHPEAFTCRDYREAFGKFSDRFDAVIVATPDHTHAPILLTAMAHDKLVYGQKPLVLHLAELSMVVAALKARPHLVTQMGNQRMSQPGRRAALEILRRGMLGKVVEAHAWTSAPVPGSYFNFNKVLRELPGPPAGLDWDLWLGPAAAMPFHDDLVPCKWRSWWDFGTNGIGDWACHHIDVLFLAFGELGSPVSVKTDCPAPAGPVFHAAPCRSTLIYQTDSSRFAGKTFALHLADSGQVPDAGQLRLPQPPAGDNLLAVVCEGGTLTMDPEGAMKVWRDGKAEPGMRLDGLPKKWQPLNHRHAWVDACLGRPTELLTPFKDAVRITEPALLAVKASRFPGRELLWDRASLAFTNHDEATRTIVRRQYRDGFAPPSFG